MLRLTVLLATFSVLLPLSAGAQDACTVDSGIHVGSPACPYQWVGVTTVLYDGTGNGLGFVGMTSQCRADFGAGARMCTSQEIHESDTHNLNAIPLDGCWIRPSWRPMNYNGNGLLSLDESGTTGSPLNQACRAWSSPSSNDQGLMLAPSGSISLQSCSVERSVACCKPTPVPAPSAALSLPVGALGLVGLSVLKGSA